MGKKQRAKGRVELCSYGLYPGQLTLETISALRRCDVVFSDALDKTSSRWMLKYCDDVRILSEMFPVSEGVKMEKVMRDRAQSVLTEAEKGRATGILVYGHPAFLCSVTEIVISECERRDIPYSVQAAVSSLNTVMSAVGQRMLPPAGLRLYSLCTWDPESQPFHSRAAMLFFDLYAFDSRNSGLLRDRLLGAYPAAHKVSFVRCRNVESEESTVIETTIEKLPKTLSRVNLDVCTLFVPAAPGPSGKSD